MPQAAHDRHLNAIGTRPVPRLLLGFSVPSIVSMTVESLYNVVDRVFIGQGAGWLGLAGVTLCFPIVLVVMALSMMVGVGGNTLFAIRLGERKYGQASIILNNSFTLLLLISGAVLLVGQLFMEPILRAVGASEQTLPEASAYLRILLWGAFFQVTTPGMNHFIRSMGHPKAAMARMLVGAGVNTFLDWLFIMKFGWGIRGAAWATVLAQACSTAFVMAFFFGKDSPIRLSLRHMRLQAAYARRIVAMGVSPSTMQVCNSLVNVILNRSLVKYGASSPYGGDLAVSAMGIVHSVFMMVAMPVMGVVQGAQPLIGYNYGAKLFPRVRETLKYAFGWGVAFMTVAWAGVQVFAPGIVSLFSDEPGLTDLSRSALRVFAAAMPCVAVGMITGNFFQGIGRPWRALFINLCRQVIVLIPLLLVVPRIFGLTGVFMAQPISDALSAALALAMISVELKRMSALERASAAKTELPEETSA